jgi:hypothetical protein
MAQVIISPTAGMTALRQRAETGTAGYIIIL